jgi:hypothetical protein
MFSIIVLERDAGDLVDRVEDGLAGVLAGDVFLRQDCLGLGRVRCGNAAHFLHAAAGAGDDDFLVEINRAGRLREGRRGKAEGEGNGGRADGEERLELHGFSTPVAPRFAPGGSWQKMRAGICCESAVNPVLPGSYKHRRAT